MRKPTAVVGIVLIALAMVLSAVGYHLVTANLRKPSMEEMRAFRLSKLTDENLRDLHDKAKMRVEALHAEMTDAMKAATDRNWAEITECRAKINDAAYRARHYPNGCPRPPSVAPDEYTPAVRIQSVNEAYENMIMDGCESKTTVLEARYAGCLR